ncbi:MAG TPA: type II toxin-antitoxin system RelE/ParE family toxin [Desulfuromonadaceae bacterium]
MQMIYKTRHFNRWARKAELTDRALCRAVAEIRQGLVDADLGGGIIKKRVALPGHGKRGSTRTLLATNRNDRWIFVYGFEKNERANISDNELEALKLLAVDLLALTESQISEAVSKGALLEVPYET